MFERKPATKASIKNRRPVCGIGINDAEYSVKPKTNGVRSICPFYATWIYMLVRCYNHKCQQQQPSYKGCSVDPVWHRFSSFQEWMSDQDWKGNQLDKDILVTGNKIYSPETSIFVPSTLNSLLAITVNAVNGCPPGVFYSKASKAYVSACRNEAGTTHRIGCFDDKLVAHKAYCEFKAQIVSDVSERYDGKVRAALLRISAELRNGEYFSKRGGYDPAKAIQINQEG